MKEKGFPGKIILYRLMGNYLYNLPFQVTIDSLSAWLPNHTNLFFSLLIIYKKFY